MEKCQGYIRGMRGRRNVYSQLAYVLCNPLVLSVCHSHENVVPFSSVVLGPGRSPIPMSSFTSSRPHAFWLGSSHEDFRPVTVILVYRRRRL